MAHEQQKPVADVAASGNLYFILFKFITTIKNDNFIHTDYFY